MRLQGRFNHCFKPGNEWTIEAAQEYVDKKWDELLSKCVQDSETADVDSSPCGGENGERMHMENNLFTNNEEIQNS